MTEDSYKRKTENLEKLYENLLAQLSALQNAPTPTPIEGLEITIDAKVTESLQRLDQQRSTGSVADIKHLETQLKAKLDGIASRADRLEQQQDDLINARIGGIQEDLTKQMTVEFKKVRDYMHTELAVQNYLKNMADVQQTRNMKLDEKEAWQKKEQANRREQDRIKAADAADANQRLEFEVQILRESIDLITQQNQYEDQASSIYSEHEEIMPDSSDLGHRSFFQEDLINSHEETEGIDRDSDECANMEA